MKIGAKPVNVPSSIPVQDTTAGQVYSSDLQSYFMRTDTGGTVNLATGVYSAGVSPNVPVTVFPAAKLDLG